MSQELHIPYPTRSPSSALLPFLGGGFPTKIDYSRKGIRILTSLLEDLVKGSGVLLLIHNQRNPASN